MIASGSEKPADLERCLRSIKDQVDGMYVLITSSLKDKKLREVAESLGAVVEYKPRSFFHKITKEEVKFIKSLGIKPHISEGDKIFEFDKARNYSMSMVPYRDWETDRKSTRLNSSHITRSRMPSSA